MSSSTPEPIPAAVLTVSDSSARGERADVSGPRVADLLEQHNFTVQAREIVADDQQAISEALLRLSAIARLVVTTGGTGIARRDRTPEATRDVSEFLLEGVAQQMRAAGMTKTPFAALSRAVCGVRDRSIILNVPGSPKGAVESLQAVIDLLPHALALLAGNTKHEE
jgi:molybdenum cofactor synthesis domain-containing protein